MRTLGNLLWFLFCGLWQGMFWLLFGCLWCLTIIGFPIGYQCFKIATFVIFPFGKTIHYGGSVGSLIANILWLIFGGLPLALAAAVNGLLLSITIIGIPFGLQCFKFAKLALMPFGTTIVPSRDSFV